MSLIFIFGLIVFLSFIGSLVLYSGLVLVTDYEHDMILGIKPKLLGYGLSVIGLLLISCCLLISFITG